MQIKHAILYFFLSVFISISTCCVISPWKSIVYTNLESKNNKYYEVPKENNRNSKYFVNNAFFLIDAIGISPGEAWDWYNEQSPYKITIQVKGKKEYHDSLILHKIKIESSTNNIYNVDGMDLFPKTVNFNQIQNTDEIIFATIFLGKYYFDSVNNEQITISIDVEVKSNNGKVERKVIVFLLQPIVKRGVFKFVSV